MKILFPIILLVFLAACGSDNTEENISQNIPPSQVQTVKENTDTNEEVAQEITTIEEEEEEEEITTNTYDSQESYTDHSVEPVTSSHSS